MPRRRPALATALVAAAALIAPATAVASLAQPAIVDAAGDAPNRFGTNQAAVDILSLDVTTDGTTLRYRFTFAGTPRITRDTNYALGTHLPAAGVPGFDGALPLVATLDGTGAPDLSNAPAMGDNFGTPPDYRYRVFGTATISGSTLTFSYPLAQLNSQLAAIGAPTLAPGTVLERTGGTVLDESRNLFGQPTLRAARDGAFDAGALTLGGD